MSNQNINSNDLDVLIGKLQELKEEDAKFIKILLILVIEHIRRKKE